MDYVTISQCFWAFMASVSILLGLAELYNFIKCYIDDNIKEFNSFFDEEDEDWGKPSLVFTLFAIWFLVIPIVSVAPAFGWPVAVPAILGYLIVNHLRKIRRLEKKVEKGKKEDETETKP